jgi:ATP-dependent DNA helicase RecG
MALFDNWEQAILDECPVQKSINNHLTITNERGMVIRSINEKLQVGGKVVFVYPSVSASAKYSCINAYDRLDKHFDGKVGLIHSKVPADQKAATMQAFASGEKPLLVTSSIFEVGIDVPGITCMVVNQADRFGVAQLHQMRGRLVRSGGEADFFMVIEQSTKKHTLERLNAVRDNNNGFALSERDLEIRGFGELLGDAQSGSTDTLFKLANLQPLDFLQPNVITTALQKDEPR